MTRDQLFKKFGPQLLEAITLLLLDTINELRTDKGQPLIKQTDIFDLIDAQLSRLEKYDWQTQNRPGH